MPKILKIRSNLFKLFTEDGRSFFGHGVECILLESINQSIFVTEC